MGNWSKLQTEQRNPATEYIDEVSTLEMLAIINREDALVSAVVATQLAPIAEAVDLVASQLGNRRPPVLPRRGHQRSARRAGCC